MTTTRRIRIVCISDTHNQTPKLPSGDLLIHAGDLTNQGTFSELQKTVRWLQQTDFRVKIVICGNHDITCDVPFYEQNGAYFHNKKREDPQKCIDLFHVDPTIIYLNHEAKVIRLDHDDNTYTLVKVFGSPYSPANGFWAFGYKPQEAFHLWKQIPLDSDLVVIHSPAKFHRDQCGTRGAAGCEILREALWRVRPRLFVCGHIHEAYGVETVEWDLTLPVGQHKVTSVRQWRDAAPESKKQYIVDLSSRSQHSALRNDWSADIPLPPQSSDQGLFADGESTSDENIMLDSVLATDSASDETPPDVRSRAATVSEASDNGSATTTRILNSRQDLSLDQTAIYGRERRLETCIINAAFMATNWPHKTGKKFHKPIVIDIDLPVLHNSIDPLPLQPSSITNLA